MTIGEKDLRILITGEQTGVDEIANTRIFQNNGYTPNETEEMMNK